VWAEGVTIMNWTLPNLDFSHPALERPAVLLPIALLLLAAAGGVMWTNLTAHERAAPPVTANRIQPAMVSVLVSASDIARGQVLNPQDVMIRAVAPSKAPAMALHKTDEMQGHMALTPIPAGKPILASQISPDAVVGLSARIPASYRAYSIPVSEADIAGGFVQAGDRVDLFVTLPGALFAQGAEQKPDDRSKATLLLQSVQILAVGARLKSDGTATPSVRTVTVALSPADLSKVALATRLGTITFAVRNPVDDAAESISQAELSNLVGTPVPTQTRTQAAKHAAGIPFFAGREHTALHLP
jgi:pilus assembly protein CpaB